MSTPRRQRSTIPPPTASERWDFGALEQRVYGLERSIEDLGKKIDARSSTQWPAVMALLSFIGLAGVVVYLPISQAQAYSNQAIAAVAADVDKIAATLAGVNANLSDDIDEVAAEFRTALADLPEKFVPRSELKERLDMNDKHMEQMTASLLRLQENVFPREVHVQRWEAIAAENDHVRGEVANVREAVQSISPASNTLESIIQRIERLEGRFIDRRMPSDASGGSGF